MVKTQWLLFVELHQFRNLYHAEVDVRGYGSCCCDDPSTYMDCCDGGDYYPSLCTPDCDTWLNASVSHCIEPNACSFSTPVQFHTASIDNFNEKFIFALSCSSNAVRITRIKFMHSSLINIILLKLLGSSAFDYKSV